MPCESDEERLTLFRTFVARFRPAGSPPARPVIPGEVSTAEKKLDAWFPASITQFWLAHGSGEYPALAAAANVFPRPANCPPP